MLMNQNSHHQLARHRERMFSEVEFATLCFTTCLSQHLQLNIAYFSSSCPCDLDPEERKYLSLQSSQFE